MMARMHQLPPGDSERAALRERVIAEYMHYARHLLTRYGIPLQAVEDFQQVAYVGLIKAVDGFDPEQGTAFLTYATPTILARSDATSGTASGRCTSPAGPRSSPPSCARRPSPSSTA